MLGIIFQLIFIKIYLKGNLGKDSEFLFCDLSAGCAEGLLVGEYVCRLSWAWLIIGAFKLSLSFWGIRCPHPCPRTLWEQMILINFARMEGMCLCSLSCPHTEKPNLTNPLIKISFSHHPISALSSSDIDADLSFLICTQRWSDEGGGESRTDRRCGRVVINDEYPLPSITADTWGMAITVNTVSPACRWRVRLPSHQLR